MEWYYELEFIKTGEKLYAPLRFHLKPERVSSVYSIARFAKCNGEISKEDFILKRAKAQVATR